jgi:hypothetical protein
MAVKSLAQSSLIQPSSVTSLLGDYESNYFHHLETVRLSAATNGVSFTNLSRYADYRHFQIRFVSVLDGGGEIGMTFNGDTTSGNYYHHQMYSTGGGIGAGATNTYQLSYQWVAGINGTIVDLLEPFNTSKFKVSRAHSGNSVVGAGTNFLSSHLWKNTAAINSINIFKFSGNFSSGGRFSLYGVKG